MGRVDYYDDPSTPPANSLVVGGSAIVTDEQGRILLLRRSDNLLWALPGGMMDIGETFGQSVVREVQEETGIRVTPERIVGIYSDPKHVFAYDDGEVRQEFNICLACRIVGGDLRGSEESLEVGFFSAVEIDRLDMHRSIRRRIRDSLESREPVIE